MYKCGATYKLVGESQRVSTSGLGSEYRRWRLRSASRRNVAVHPSSAQWSCPCMCLCRGRRALLLCNIASGRHDNERAQKTHLRGRPCSLRTSSLFAPASMPVYLCLGLWTCGVARLHVRKTRRGRLLIAVATRRRSSRGDYPGNIFLEIEDAIARGEPFANFLSAICALEGEREVVV